MKTTSLDNDAVRRYIPNVLAEAEGETPLADKLAPFVESAKVWLEKEYLGPDDFLSDAHNEYALKILVTKAFADAVPSLDLVVTPSGMGVISTDSLAPASKERVERLVKSLNDYVDTNVLTLLDICRNYEAWRLSERGRYYCATFVSSPLDCKYVREFVGVSYDEIRSRAIVAESKLADRYLGRQMMDTLRDDYNSGKLDKGHPLVTAVRVAVLTLVTSDMGVPMLDQNRLWHVTQHVLRELRYYPEYHKLWDTEMHDRFAAPGFVNDIKGGFYF